MPYDRYGRTPEMAKRERVGETLTVLALGLMIAGVVACAVLVVTMLSV